MWFSARTQDPSVEGDRPSGSPRSVLRALCLPEVAHWGTAGVAGGPYGVLETSPSPKWTHRLSWGAPAWGTLWSSA